MRDANKLSRAHIAGKWNGDREYEARPCDSEPPATARPADNFARFFAREQREVHVACVSVRKA